MIRLPFKNVQDPQARGNFEALERQDTYQLGEYPVGKAPNPPLSGAILYTVDNGAGKTRLMVLFPTGAAQQLSIEP
jgi:hypothetical protein